MRRLLSQIVIFMLLAVCFTVPNGVYAATHASFKLTPETVTANSGQVMSFTLRGENLNDLYAYEAVISFDPEKVEPVGATARMQGFSVPLQQDGNQLIVAFTKIGKGKGVDGNWDLHTIKFKLKTNSNTEIKLESVKAVDSNLGSREYPVNVSGRVIYSPGTSSGTNDNNTNTNRTGAGIITPDELDRLFENVLPDDDGIKSITLQIDPVQGATEYMQKFIASSLTSEEVTRKIILSTPNGNIIIPDTILKDADVDGNAEVAVTIRSVTPESLPAEVEEIIGDRPVVDVHISVGGKTISQFAADVEVSVPYTPKEGEDYNAIVVYYLNADGKPEIVKNGKYNPETGMVTFRTDHFSLYAVGYNEINFNDVSSDAWYKNAVVFIASRGITNGTGNNKYSPTAKLTRGEFIVLIMRAYDIAPDTDAKDNFSDAGNTYYTGYLAAAKRLGISAGVGNNLFAPGAEITRQEMFTLVYNALKVIGRLPSGKSGTTLEAFSDADKVASWAKAGMSYLVEAGTIRGSGNRLFPTDTTTRAEMAQVLFNLLSE